MFVLVLVLVVVGFMRYHQDHVVLCFVVSSSCLTVMVMVMMSGICMNGSHMDICLGVCKADKSVVDLGLLHRASLHLFSFRPPFGVSLLVIA